MADRIPTFADICSAIAEGRLNATLDGPTYQVNAYELRRYLNKFRSLPTISFTDVQEEISDTEPAIWSESVQTSVA